MTREQFKELWESNNEGGGITFNDIADCAISWGVSSCPYTQEMRVVQYQVLVEAKTNDAEEFNPYKM